MRPLSLAAFERCSHNFLFVAVIEYSLLASERWLPLWTHGQEISANLISYLMRFCDPVVSEQRCGCELRWLDRWRITEWYLDAKTLNIISTHLVPLLALIIDGITANRNTLTIRIPDTNIRSAAVRRGRFR